MSVSLSVGWLLPLHRCPSPAPWVALKRRSTPSLRLAPLCYAAASPRLALPLQCHASLCPCKAVSRFAHAGPCVALPMLCEPMPWLRESEPPPSAAPLHRPSMLRRCASWLSLALPPLVTDGLCPRVAVPCLCCALRFHRRYAMHLNAQAMQFRAMPPRWIALPMPSSAPRCQSAEQL